MNEDSTKIKPMKTAFLFLDAFIFISACLLLGFVFYGVAVTENKDFEAGGLNLINGYPYLFAIVGYAILVTIIGCWGALVNSRCFLVFYTIMIFGLVLAVCYFMVVSIIEILRKVEVKSKLETSMMDALRNYGNSINPPPSNFWNSIQTSFKCCGVKSYSDWGNNREIAPDRIPTSCCVMPRRPTCESASNQNDFYSNGCLEKIASYYNIIMYILIGLLGLILLFSVPNFFLGMCVSANL